MLILRYAADRAIVFVAPDVGRVEDPAREVAAVRLASPHTLQLRYGQPMGIRARGLSAPMSCRSLR
jgi:hypothetical protein